MHGSATLLLMPSSTEGHWDHFPLLGTVNSTATHIQVFVSMPVFISLERDLGIIE